MKKYRFLDNKYDKEDYDFVKKYFEILKSKYKKNGKVMIELLEFYEKNVAVKNKNKKEVWEWGFLSKIIKGMVIYGR